MEHHSARNGCLFKPLLWNTEGCIACRPHLANPAHERVCLTAGKSLAVIASPQWACSGGVILRDVAG